MTKGEIIDFEVLRIQNDLDNYKRTNTIPHTILEGTFDIEEIKDVFLNTLPPKYKKIGKRLVNEYYEKINENLESLKTAMKRDYDRVFKNMASAHESFRYKQIMNLYRPGINPIRALYYQTRDVSRRYNPEHPYHYWLIDLVTDLEFNNIIEQSRFSLNEIKNLYFFPSKRWDIELNNSIFVKLPKNDLKNTLNYIFNFLANNNLKDNTIIDKVSKKFSI